MRRFVRSRLMVASSVVALATFTTVGVASAASAAISVTATYVTGSAIADPYFSATSHDGKWLAVANTSDGDVALVNTDTGVVTNIALDAGAQPGGIVFSPDDAKLYVTSLDTYVAVIDMATLTRDADITTIDWSETWALSITPDGSTLLVDDSDNDYFYTYDLTTSTASPVPVSTSNTSQILPTADGTHVYLVQEDGTVKYVKLSDMSVVWEHTPVGSFTVYSAALSLDEQHIYFANYTDGTQIYDVDTATQAFTPVTIAGAVKLSGVALNALGTKLYASDYIGAGLGQSTGGFVYDLDPATLAVNETISVGDYNHAITTSASGCVYVSDYYGDSYQLGSCKSAPEPDAALPNTGIDVTAASAGVALSILVIGAGGIAFTISRRRNA